VLSAWVDAAETLRTAIHALESERGPLVESLFPEWRGPSLRRHADQARAAETELQRRLASGYVVRRLAELATHDALGAALEGLAAAGTTWAADRDRPSLEGAEGDAVRTRLLAMAGRTAHLLDRVRWVVRAALADRPELIDAVFPKRTRQPQAAGGSPPVSGTDAPSATDDPATRTIGATRTADARGTATTDAPPERPPATRRARPARTTGEADASPTEAPASRTTGRSTGKPKSRETSASDSGGRSARAEKPSNAPSIRGPERAGKADPSEASARSSGRSRDPPEASDAPAGGTPRRSTRRPGSSAAAVPAPQPSARGSRRQARPPRRS